MKPEGRDAFWPLTEDCEGKVFCIYLDVLGLATAAVGNLCDDVHVAMSMPFFRPDGTRATPDDIRAEHTRVKAAFCGVKGAEPGVRCAYRGTGKTCLAHGGWKAAMRMTSLRLTVEGVKQIVLGKLDANEKELVKRFPAFEEWPWQAQLATHSMAWACGAAFHYPLLARALEAQDFEKAAAECHIREEGNEGVAPRNVRNKALYLAAAGLEPFVFDLSNTKGVQAALSRLGFDPGVVDGIPGAKTNAAVVSFQSAHGLTPDGVLGPKTRAALETALRTAA